CSVWSMCEQCGTTQEMPVGSILLGRLDGVCIIFRKPLRRKSPEPPRPLIILGPPTREGLPWAYMSISTGVFIAMHPRRRIGSGALEMESGRRVILSKYLSMFSKNFG